MCIHSGLARNSMTWFNIKSMLERIPLQALNFKGEAVAQNLMFGLRSLLCGKLWVHHQLIRCCNKNVCVKNQPANSSIICSRNFRIVRTLSGHPLSLLSFSLWWVADITNSKSTALEIFLCLPTNCMNSVHRLRSRSCKRLSVCVWLMRIEWSQDDENDSSRKTFFKMFQVNRTHGLYMFMVRHMPVCACGLDVSERAFYYFHCLFFFHSSTALFYYFIHHRHRHHHHQLLL